MADRVRHNGDRGRTSLADGSPVAKDSLAVEAYGAFDELDAFAGLARVSILEDINQSKERDLLLRGIDLVQEASWLTGASLANPSTGPARDPVDLMCRVEDFCRQVEQEAGPVKGFVLPGVTRSEALLHVCRTVCRRAERRTVSALAKSAGDMSHTGSSWEISLVNRLSSLLFAASRLALKALGREPVYRP